MSLTYFRVSAMLTLLSFSTLHWWTTRLVDKFADDGVIEAGLVNWENIQLLKILWESHATIALGVIFLVNVFILVILSFKTLFFVELYPTEIRKMLERLFNYIIYKGAFLPLVVPSNVLNVGMWSTWLVTMSSLKMFQTLAKDRLERLNSSPSATRWTYFRVFSALVFVLISDIIWVCLCTITWGNAAASIFMLLLFEPLSIAFDTLQAIIVHGFQLLEMWQNCSPDENDVCGASRSSHKIAGASLCEWKTSLTRNFGFILDTMTLLMALGHYLIIWWLHGMSFHLVDAILFWNLRALVSTIIKRTRGFIKLKKALSSLDVALNDATSEEIHSYDDDCAICREPMSKAKRLACNHLFHLSCLRSWLDQGISEVHSCPTCRRPLFQSTYEIHPNTQTGDVQNGLQGNLGVNQNQQPVPGQTMLNGTSFGHQQNPSDNVWRASGIDATWVPPWLSPPEVDVVGTSSATNPASHSRAQAVARRLASVSETYAHDAVEDTTPWNFWSSQQWETITASIRVNPRNNAGLRFRNNSAVASNMPDINIMVERVREILPHIPDELIIQDLQRTNNPATTVNNFLP
ncbi:E3 ubiquitin protein ligase RIN2 [Zostera marina]|uniref:E3 ubiquitin protein ligase RIN2 n=1 Tax=Zostera marina TaxID=29655 RepID=A0A0K9NNC6_ZOSMR|nr:E3 ubiquitin protein ligase RIN2 [Zostera marina]